MPFELTELKIKLDQKGLRKVLGRTEYEVMEILWLNGKSSIRQVAEKLKEHREISLTTVQTIMNRMVGKSLLEVQRFNKIGYYYASVSREQLITFVVRATIDSLFCDFPEIMDFYFKEYEN